MSRELKPLAVGAQAPALDLAALAPPLPLAPRRLLLCFLPLAGAPVCTADAKALAAAAPELLRFAEAIVVVSVDASAHLRRFLDEQGGARLHALSDRSLALARAYGVAWPQRFAARATFLVEQGVVRAAALHPIAFPRPLDLIRSWGSARG